MRLLYIVSNLVYLFGSSGSPVGWQGTHSEERREQEPVHNSLDGTPDDPSLPVPTTQDEKERVEQFDPSR